MAIAKRRTWVYVLAVFAGLVLGGLLGKLCEGSQYLWWLDYGMSFGFDATAPFTIDLYILKFTLAVGFWFKINVASILGVLISFLIFRKL